jgi:hypothetical protein
MRSGWLGVDCIRDVGVGGDEMSKAEEALYKALDTLPLPFPTYGLRSHQWIKDTVPAIIRAHDAEREPCKWTYDADSDLWSSSCGEDWIFIDGGPLENECKFCHGCGKPIAVVGEDARK